MNSPKTSYKRNGARVILVAALAVIVGISIILFVMRSKDGKASSPKITIRLALFKSPAVDAAQKIIPEFEAETGLAVDLEILPYAELQDKVQTEFLARSPRYDIVMADCIWIPKFAAAGYLLPIDKFLANPSLTPKGYDLSDLIPSVADYLGKYPANGTTYGFPFMTNTHVLAYREDLFRKHLEPRGFRRPGETVSDAWTWDEYISAAEVLTMSDSSVQGGKLWGSSMQARAGAWLVYEWYSWLYGFGGRDIDYKNMTPQFDSPKSIQAMRKYSSMVDKVAPPTVLSWGHEEETQALATGLVAMDATWNVELTGYLIDEATSPHAKNFRFALSPVGELAKPTPDMGGYGLLMSRFSSHPEEAYRLMVWLTSPGIHKRIVMGGGTPFRYSEMKDQKILQKYPVYKIYGVALENSIYRARVPQWPQIEDVISKELTPVLSGSQTPEQAATAMQDKIGRLIRATER